MTSLKYLTAYPPDLQARVQALIHEGELATWLRRRYPAAHRIRSDRALYDYVSGLKNQFLRGAAAVDKIFFDSKIQVIQHALGLHAAVSRVQGNRLKSSHEIRIAAMFRDAPPEFLRMIAVHELAHLKERQHDRAFYKLCVYMEPAYHQLEFDVRLYLTHLDLSSGARIWVGEGV